MKIHLLLIALLIPLTSFSRDGFLDFGLDDYEPRQSRLNFEMGFRNFSNTMSLIPFDGSMYVASDEEDFTLYGVELGFGGELFIYEGFSFGLGAKAYYLSNFSSDIGDTTASFDSKFASTKFEASLVGTEGSALFAYSFLRDTYELRPYIEIGIGAATLDSKAKYDFEGKEGDKSDSEFYNFKGNHTFLTARTSIGTKVISPYGIYSYFVVSQEIYTLMNEKLSYSYKDKNKATDNVNSKKTKNIKSNTDLVSFTVGFGFMF